MKIWTPLLVATVFAATWASAARAAQDLEPRERTTPEAISNAQATQSAASGVAGCAQMAARLDKSKALLGELDKMTGFLDRLGNVLTAASVVQHTYEASKTGDTGGLINDAAGLIVSKGGCAAFGIYCPVYSAGMGIGTIIDQAPKVFGWSDRTLNDMWTDMWFDIIEGSGEPTEAEIQAKIATLRAKIQKARADSADAEARNAQCTDKEKRKTAVDEILAKAKARAGAATTVDFDPELVSDTSAAAANAAAARGAVISSEFQGIANSAQSASAAMQARGSVNQPTQSLASSENLWDSKHCFQWVGWGWVSPDGSAYNRPECTGQPPPPPPKPPCVAIGGGDCAAQ